MTDSNKRDFAPLMVRLAVLWIAAGAAFKLFAGTPADLPQAVRDFPLGLDLTYKLAIGAELSIVFAAFLRPKLAWPAVVALFLVFEGILSLGLVAGDESCGCFGTDVVISPLVMMIIDSVLLVGILATRPWRSSSKGIGSIWLIPILVVISVATPFLYIGKQDGGLDGEGNVADRYVLLNMDTWPDKYIYDTELAKYLPELDTLPTDGTYAFYRSTCEHCAAHLEEMAMNDDGTLPIVLLRILEKGDNEKNWIVHTMPTGPHVIELNMPEGEYMLTTPADFRLEGGVVVEARDDIHLEGAEDESGEPGSSGK